MKAKTENAAKRLTLILNTQSLLYKSDFDAVNCLNF